MVNSKLCSEVGPLACVLLVESMGLLSTMLATYDIGSIPPNSVASNSDKMSRKQAGVRILGGWFTIIPNRLKEAKPKHGWNYWDLFHQACLWVFALNDCSLILEAVNNPQHAVVTELDRGIGKLHRRQNSCFDFLIIRSSWFC